MSKVDVVVPLRSRWRKAMSTPFYTTNSDLNEVHQTALRYVADQGGKIYAKKAWNEYEEVLEAADKELVPIELALFQKDSEEYIIDDYGQRNVNNLQTEKMRVIERVKQAQKRWMQDEQSKWTQPSYGSTS